MKVAVLGTGMVGRTLAARLAELGHAVTIGTRDVDATIARTGSDAHGQPAVRRVGRGQPAGGAGHVRRRGRRRRAGAERHCRDRIDPGPEAAGRDRLAGKVLLDIANPLDYSQGFPPSLFVSNTESLAEQIQAAFPEVRVVKSLNTMNAFLMADPRQLADGDHSVFVSGDDADAKEVVTELLRSFGHTDIVDLGDLSTARGTESLLPVWVRLYGVMGTPMFQFKVVR